MPRARVKGRKDQNQREIEQGLTRLGIPWADTSDLGDGFGDLVTGYRGRNVIFEIKRDGLSPSRTKLTPAERRFAEYWQGELFLVHTLEEVLSCLGVYYLPKDQNRSQSLVHD